MWIQNLGLLGRTCLLRDCPFVFLGERYRKGERELLWMAF